MCQSELERAQKSSLLSWACGRQALGHYCRDQSQVLGLQIEARGKFLLPTEGLWDNRDEREEEIKVVRA